MPPSDSSELLGDLRAIASNYAWTWNLDLRSILRDALGDAWGGATHPNIAVGALDESQVAGLSANDDLRARITEAAASVRLLEAERPADVAYISAEFGVSETLPQYSGGLGILAGDHLKAASDLDLGLTAIGLFYANGYFAQSVDDDGQVVSYETYDPADLGLANTGVQIEVETPRGPIHAAVWLAHIGGVRLYMLDSRVAANTSAWARDVTDRLYGGDQQKRIDQEMLLGIGGLRALEALGVEPKMVHLNEGHAGFCLLEMLAAELGHGASFEAAQAAVRERTLFTTHTPVPAGIDRFPRALLKPYLQQWSTKTGIDMATIWAEGDLPSDKAPDEFNMAAFCLGHAAMTNGVSALHGEVSRSLFSSRPEGAAITSVTNGVHARTWTDPATQSFLDERLPAGWDQGDPASWAASAGLDAAGVAALRTTLRKQMVEQFNERYDLTLDPDVLTVGFARRFATYKRAALLLREPERLEALLANDDQPVQFVFAGKAHPADTPGQKILAEVLDYGRSATANGRFAFIPGYDIEIAGLLYGGCDVWLNNPVRPQEACGTSGEKSVLNGGLNCSILDGWWAEWFDATNGWAIPTSDAKDTKVRDTAEAKALHDLLADEVVPEFYADGPHGSGQHGSGQGGPSQVWIDRILAGWQILGPKVTAGRMVAEYSERLYRPMIDAQGS